MCISSVNITYQVEYSHIQRFKLKCKPSESVQNMIALLEINVKYSVKHEALKPHIISRHCIQDIHEYCAPTSTLIEHSRCIMYKAGCNEGG